MITSKWAVYLLCREYGKLARVTMSMENIPSYHFCCYAHLTMTSELECRSMLIIVPTRHLIARP